RLHGPESGGDICEIEDTEEKGKLLERPVPPGEDDPEKYKSDTGKSNQRGDAEDAHGRGHADVFGHEGKPVYDRKVEDRKPAPKGSEAVEDGLCVAALRYRA